MRTVNVALFRDFVNVAKHSNLHPITAGELIILDDALRALEKIDRLRDKAFGLERRDFSERLAVREEILTELKDL